MTNATLAYTETEKQLFNRMFVDYSNLSHWYGVLLKKYNKEAWDSFFELYKTINLKYISDLTMNRDVLYKVLEVMRDEANFSEALQILGEASGNLKPKSVEIKPLYVRYTMSDEEKRLQVEYNEKHNDDPELEEYF